MIDGEILFERIKRLDVQEELKGRLSRWVAITLSEISEV
jgi:hypothetical protein